MTETTITIEARTSRGVLIKTFSDRAIALKWWDDSGPQFPGASLEEITTEVRVTRRSIRRPKLQLVRSA